MISIIIRTRNEERWISQSLKQIAAQTLRDYEVVLVDNRSIDKTVQRARHIFPQLIHVDIEEYLPGLAINEGIRASSGELIVCLSAHCIPCDCTWLENLARNFKEPSVAGVYGRQVPMNFSSPHDKRDLMVTFGLDRRVQRKDFFFHNANSMFRRDIWERIPFDESVTNIEDRIWGKSVIEAGHSLVYEPDAPVWHYHGIHQNGDRDRCENVVRIMESMEDDGVQAGALFPESMEVAAIIPLRSDSFLDNHESLVLQTVSAAKQSRHINRIIVSTDSKIIAGRARRWGLDTPFLRPQALTQPEVRVDTILAYTLERLESQGYHPDVLLPLEITFPFRPEGLLDHLVSTLLEKGLDTVMAGFPEYRPVWAKQQEDLIRMDDPATRRDAREPLLVGLPSLGCATYPECIRQGSRLGERVGIFEISDPLCGLEIRSRENLKMYERIKDVFFGARPAVQGPDKPVTVSGLEKLTGRVG